MNISNIFSISIPFLPKYFTKIKDNLDESITNEINPPKQFNQIQ